ncbi:MAG: gamma-glutamylcyclotransferase [Burkholderiales bacterium]|nr:gamma-glutamylcyclotransferase [Burkholderiales bacterium]
MGLTRIDLERDRIRQELALTPLGQHLLTDAELQESLWQILEARETDEDCWIFGYGSLVWNPLFHFEEKRVVTTHGYHRSFCLWSRINRGTIDRPGLVLGLDRGGRCRGVAYRIATDHAENELRLVWRREMLLGAYIPRWVTVSDGESQFRAITFTINRAGPAYAGRLSPEAIVERLTTCHGRMGPGLDYLVHTAEALRACGIEDRHLRELCERADAIKARG